MSLGATLVIRSYILSDKNIYNNNIMLWAGGVDVNENKGHRPE